MYIFLVFIYSNNHNCENVIYLVVMFMYTVNLNILGKYITQVFRLITSMIYSSQQVYVTMHVIQKLTSLINVYNGMCN